MADSVITQVLQILGEDKSSKAFDSVKARLSKLDVAFGTTMGNLATQAIRSFGQFTVSAFKAVDELNDLKISTGIGNQALAALEVQAGLSGTSLEEAAKGALKLGQATEDALIGKATPATKALAALGVTTEQLSKVQNDSVGQFKLLAEAQSKWSDGAVKSSEIADVFGGKNTAMLRLLQDSGRGFDEATKLVKDFGLELNDIQIRGLVQANDAVDSLKFATMGLARQVAADLAPTITALSKTFLDMGRNAEQGGSKVGGAIDKINFVIGVALELANVLGTGLNVLKLGLIEVGQTVLTVGSGIVELFTFVATAGGLIDIGPLERFNLALRDLKDQGFAEIAAATQQMIDDQKGLGDSIAEFLERVTAARIAAQGTTTDFKAKPPPSEAADPDKAAAAEAARLAKRDAARKEALGRELETIADGMKTERQLLRDKERADLEIIDEANQRKILSDEATAQFRLAVEDRYHKDLAALQEAHNAEVFAKKAEFLEQVSGLSQKQLTDLHDFNNQNTQDQAATVTGTLATVFGQLGAHSKKAFAVSKAFAIAEAIINTYKGVTLALATYPPPYSFVVAASVLAAGLAQVAKIRSAQPGGGSGGGGVGGGASVGVGSTTGGGTTSTAPTPRAGVGAATIVLEGHTFSREAVLDLVESINDVLGDGATLAIETKG